MKIYTEIPEATKPERAWITGDKLNVDYHRWSKDNYYYVDAHFEEHIDFIHTMRLKYGKRGGFHGMYLIHGDDFAVFELSKNHKEVITEMYKLLKGHIEIKKETVGEEVNDDGTQDSN